MDRLTRESPKRTPHLTLNGVEKSFGATRALRHASIEIRSGAVHSLVGENGAGKSTLGKIMTGGLRPVQGSFTLDGVEAHFDSPRQALAAGITTIAQELSLVPDRTVLDNVMLGQEDCWGPFVRKSAVRHRFDELVCRTGITVAADAIVRDLSVAAAQRVEILRAIARDARVIVMDEPTARLTADEAASLRRLILELSSRGTTVVLISHFLDEVLEVSDQITVMRDGAVVRTSEAAVESKRSLIEAMIGRDLDSAFPSKTYAAETAPTVLEITGLTKTGVFADIELTVREGEIVVLAGLVGAGRSEIARAIYGADVADGGVIRLQGTPVSFIHPAHAIEHGIAMIPEARKAQGLQLAAGVAENILLPHLAKFSRHGLLQRRRAAQAAAVEAEAVGIKSESANSPVETLSGGNQQKVLFARSFLGDPLLLIADEPTRGVDVGAKRAIYDLIVERAAKGMAVLVISSEIEEVIGLAHRVIVVARGRVTAELAGPDITEEQIALAAFAIGTTNGESKDDMHNSTRDSSASQITYRKEGNR